VCAQCLAQADGGRALPLTKRSGVDAGHDDHVACNTTVSRTYVG
jgi:hypothetical protein